MHKTPALGDVYIPPNFSFSDSPIEKGWEGWRKGRLVVGGWLGVDQLNGSQRLWPEPQVLGPGSHATSTRATGMLECRLMRAINHFQILWAWGRQVCRAGSILCQFWRKNAPETGHVPVWAAADPVVGRLPACSQKYLLPASGGPRGSGMVCI